MSDKIYSAKAKCTMSGEFAPGFRIDVRPDENSVNTTNKKRTILDSSLISNKKIKTNIQALNITPQTPVGKNYKKIVVVLDCEEDIVWLVNLTKLNAYAAHQKPKKDMSNNHPFVAMDKLNTISMPERHAPAHTENNLPYPQGSDIIYGLYGIAFF